MLEFRIRTEFTNFEIPIVVEEGTIFFGAIGVIKNLGYIDRQVLIESMGLIDGQHVLRMKTEKTDTAHMYFTLSGMYKIADMCNHNGIAASVKKIIAQAQRDAQNGGPKRKRARIKKTSAEHVTSSERRDTSYQKPYAKPNMYHKKRDGLSREIEKNIQTKSLYRKEERQMKITHIKEWGWDMALDAARTTVNKPMLNKEPSDKFKREMVLSEHSPLRLVQFQVRVEDVPSWVATHMVRHHIGIEKFVGTQRPDRTDSKLTRHELPQDDPVCVMLVFNAQAIINISRVRLCKKASKETRELVRMIVEEIRKIDPIVASACVPNCVYRCLCPEPESCGYIKTYAHEWARRDYLEALLFQ